MAKVDTLLKSINTTTILFSGSTGASAVANGTYYQVSSILYRQAVDSTWTIKYTAATTTWSVRKDDSVDSDTKVNHFTRVNSAVAGAYVATVDGEGTSPLAVTVTSGTYATNLGQKVWEWREIPIPDTAPPACVYKETDDISMFAINQWKHSLKVEFLFYGNTAGQVRQMIADFITAVGTSLTWGGLAQRTEITSEDTGSEQKGRLVFVAHIIAEITFISTYWNAYS